MSCLFHWQQWSNRSREALVNYHLCIHILIMIYAFAPPSAPSNAFAVHEQAIKNKRTNLDASID